MNKKTKQKIAYRLYKNNDKFFSEREESTVFNYIPTPLANLFGAQQTIITSDICNPYGNYVFDIWSDKPDLLKANNLTVVAVNTDDLIVGVCYFTKDKNYIHLKALCIDPSYRKQGIANDLMKEGIKQANKKYGKNNPYLLTATPDGVKLYKKNGFKPMSDEQITEYNYPEPNDETEIRMIRVSGLDETKSK